MHEQFLGFLLVERSGPDSAKHRKLITTLINRPIAIHALADAKSVPA